MHGSSWFVPDGEWSDWDVTGRLGDVAVPTLVIGGERDQCVPELSTTIAAGIPGAQLAILDSAHLPFYECPAEYLGLLRDFLHRAERAHDQGAQSGT
jgi:proline iminopeptidase